MNGVTMVLLGLLVFAADASAQVNVPYDFEPGQRAKASEVNANFDALENAIDANSVSIEDNAGAIEANAAAIAAIPTTEATILDLSNAADCIVDTPGFYILNRSWLLSPRGDSEPPYGCQLQVQANVRLDFRGFEIDVGSFWPGDTAAIQGSAGSSLSIANGSIRATDLAIEAPEATIELSTMRISGLVEIQNGTIRNSSISGHEVEAIRVTGDAVIRDSDIRCVVPCIVSGPGSVDVLNNTISGDLYPTVVVYGPGNQIRNNRISGSILLDTGADASILAWNSFDGNIDVLSNASIVESNIGGGDVNFSGTGNFYGDNRTRGQFTGTAGQTDWGGNVTY